MFKKVTFIFISFLLSLSIFSCSSNNFIDNSNIFTYEYDFKLYDIDDVSLFKATTVSTLKNVLDEKKTAIFVISSSSCSSCKHMLDSLSKLASNDVVYYVIDTYSSLYPLFDTSDFNILLNILNDLGVETSEDFVTPILLIINNGSIDSYLVGLDHNVLDSDQILDLIKNTLNKSILYQ